MKIRAGKPTMKNMIKTATRYCEMKGIALDTTDPALHEEVDAYIMRMYDLTREELTAAMTD